jgi:asparagine synthase (glutamine-hydrolysing)
MCRIAGIFNKELPIQEMEALVKEMCDLQKHGGPDDEGLYSCGATNVVLGHRRLAVIDLTSAGHQPMMYQDRYVISFNGEIYNFPELKSELELAGLHFHTNCDTEVILAAFAHWNTQSFAKLGGMFAFALYDILEKDLYLVRDASGIKPLYYSSTSNGIEFASEIRAFAPLKNKKENRSWPIYQLAYGHLPEPVTTLQDVRPLHKGCFFKYNTVSGATSLQSFTHYSFSNSIDNVAIAECAIKESIEKAVGRHLLSDAPIGVFLSGGVDSGIITSLSCHFQKEQLKTLSLYFKEEQFSEKKYQDGIIEKLHCGYYQHLLTEGEFQQSFPLNTWFISKYAKQQGLKAVLSGIGGDELFGGYPSFGRINIALQLQKMPKTFLLGSRRGYSRTLSRMPYLALGGVKGLYLFLRGQFNPAEIARQLGSTEKEVWKVLASQPLPFINGLAPKNLASWMELNMYMQNQLLRDADVMSMAHGVEIRVPFLDAQVIRTALSINWKVKYKGTLPKQTLINAFKKNLPEAVWNRKKMGFSFPFTQWLNNNVFVKDTLANGNSAAQLNYKKFTEGKLHWSQLMSLIILQTRGIL